MARHTDAGEPAAPSPPQPPPIDRESAAATPPSEGEVAPPLPPTAPTPKVTTRTIRVLQDGRPGAGAMLQLFARTAVSADHPAIEATGTIEVVLQPRAPTHR